MPALMNAPTPPVKLLLLGDSSAGKTGSLASLAAAGYQLRILDLENGLDVLGSLLSDPKSPYPASAAANVHFKTLTEAMRTAGGNIGPSASRVWPEMIKMLEHWKEPPVGDDPTTAIDLGKLSSWDESHVLVLDSLTRAAEAAQTYSEGMNGRLGKRDRRDIGAAQTMITNLLQLLADKSVRCHVVVISHITYIEDREATTVEGELPPRIGYPSAVGKALSPMIPRYFNSMLLAKTEGSGPGTRHKIYTKPQGIVGAKSSTPFSTPNSYDLGTGLAEYFKAARKGQEPKKP